MHKEHRSLIEKMLAEHGVMDMYGVELVRDIRMLANMYETIISGEMRQDKLSGPRWRLLLDLYVAEQSGQPWLSPTAMSKNLNVTKNTISSHLRSLENQGLIQRTLDSEDRRQFQIRISDEGRALIRDSTPQHIAFLNQLASDLDTAEIAQLRQLLQKLFTSLVNHGNLPETYCLNPLPIMTEND